MGARHPCGPVFLSPPLTYRPQGRGGPRGRGFPSETGDATPESHSVPPSGIHPFPHPWEGYMGNCVAISHIAFSFPGWGGGNKRTAEHVGLNGDETALPDYMELAYYDPEIEDLEPDTRPLSQRDSRPERVQYRDEGCDIAPECLACPLPKCRLTTIPAGSGARPRTGGTGRSWQPGWSSGSRPLLSPNALASPAAGSSASSRKAKKLTSLAPTEPQKTIRNLNPRPREESRTCPLTPLFNVPFPPPLVKRCQKCVAFLTSQQNRAGGREPIQSPGVIPFPFPQYQTGGICLGQGAVVRLCFSLPIPPWEGHIGKCSAFSDMPAFPEGWSPAPSPPVPN